MSQYVKPEVVTKTQLLTQTQRLLQQQIFKNSLHSLHALMFRWLLPIMVGMCAGQGAGQGDPWQKQVLASGLS